MKRAIQWVAVLALVGILAGCAATQPPQRIQEAIGTMNAYLPEYVTEANAALEAESHPDAERLTGIGERLCDGMDALDRWAKGQGDTQEGGGGQASRDQDADDVDAGDAESNAREVAGQ